MAGRHRAPHDPEAKKLERERAALEPEPTNWWMVKFSIAALVLTAAVGVFVWFEHRYAMWFVGLSALIHSINLIREARSHSRYRAANSPEKTPH
ncbi:hypothetical protein HUT17_00785 [Nocardiopsis flavescens]|nr:hypothetical protein HUT17_00785 [Nocardiopsis flavescens]